MKKLLIITAALSGALLAATAQADTKTVQGCEVVDMGGYLNKVDPTCVFNHQPGNGKPAVPATQSRLDS